MQSSRCIEPAYHIKCARKGKKSSPFIFKDYKRDQQKGLLSYFCSKTQLRWDISKNSQAKFPGYWRNHLRESDWHWRTRKISQKMLIYQNRTSTVNISLLDTRQPGTVSISVWHFPRRLHTSRAANEQHWDKLLELWSLRS